MFDGRYIPRCSSKSIFSSISLRSYLFSEVNDNEFAESSAIHLGKTLELFAVNTKLPEMTILSSKDFTAAKNSYLQ